MEFPDSDFAIFDNLLTKRPEIQEDKLKEDLKKYYLPYVKQLIDLKSKKSNSEGIIVGVSAIQGTGKTTQGEVLEILLKHFGHSSDALSIDDHYITHKQLCEVRKSDPRFIRRGVTHDIDLAITNLKNLATMTDNQPILISGYYKGAHHGDGDRFRWINLEPELTLKVRVFETEIMINKKLETARVLHLDSADYQGKEMELPDNMGSDIPVYGHFLPDDLNGFLEQNREKNLSVTIDSDGFVTFRGDGDFKLLAKALPLGWRLVRNKPDFIFYDGWMLGARPVLDDSCFDQPLDALDSEENRSFAKFINSKLHNYLPLWNMLEHFTVLFVPDYHLSIKWRDQAEEVLRAKGEGMTHEEIREFVYYFWRSVHPAIHIKNLAHDTEHTDQVVIINEDHTIREVLTPIVVKDKYP